MNQLFSLLHNFPKNSFILVNQEIIKETNKKINKETCIDMQIPFH